MKHREPIYGLDLIRFLAALAVVGWHVGYRFFDPWAHHIRIFVAGVPAGPQPIQNYTRWGWIGVQIFFVISGLVIAYSADGSTARRFLRGRVGRLLPGVLVCAALIFGIDLLFWHQPALILSRQLLKTLVFWPLGGWIAPQFWTLPVEIAFYGSVCALIATRAVRHLDWLAVALLIISALYCAILRVGLARLPVDIANLLLLRHGMYFAIGICLSSADKEGYTLGRLFLILAGIVVAALEIPQAMQTSYGVYSPSEPHLWLVPFAIWLATVGLIAASLRWKRTIARFVRSARLSGSLRTMGLSTYPLYLIHIHVVGLAATLALEAGVGLTPALLLGVVLSVFLSAIIAVLVEPRIRKVVLLPLGGPDPRKLAEEVRPSLPGLGDCSTEQA